jgi:polyadenylation factor subunit 2
MEGRKPIPLLLPKSDIPAHHPGSWKATRHLKAPEPQFHDDSKALEMEAAAIKQGIDTRPFKKVRPRRTVDYMAGVGRWNMVCCTFVFRNGP